MKAFFISMVAIVAVLLSPEFVQAQTIVPCTSGTGCGTCEFITLINNLISFIIRIMLVVASLIFAWAGFVILTAGGVVAKVEQGKAMFTNVLVGILIMLCAWLIVDTVMKALLPNGETSFGPWNEVECTSQDVLNETDELTTPSNGWADVSVDYSGVNATVGTPVMPSAGGNCPIGYSIDAFGTCQPTASTVMPNEFGDCPQYYTPSSNGADCIAPTGPITASPGGNCPTGYTFDEFGDCVWSGEVVDSTETGTSNSSTGLDGCDPAFPEGCV